MAKTKLTLSEITQILQNFFVQQGTLKPGYVIDMVRVTLRRQPAINLVLDDENGSDTRKSSAKRRKKSKNCLVDEEVKKKTKVKTKHKRTIGLVRLSSVAGLNPETVKTLAEAGIKTISAFKKLTIGDITAMSVAKADANNVRLKLNKIGAKIPAW